MAEFRWSTEHRDVVRQQPRALEIRAAAELLLDPNPRVHEACEQTLLAWGEASRTALEALCEDDDRQARIRVQRVLRTINVRSWLTNFREFAIRADRELERGMLLIAQLPRPLLDDTVVSATFDDWADQLFSQVERLGPRKLAAQLSRFFHGDLAFRGDRNNYYDPDNSFLDQVVKNRCGVPITLCAVWLLVGRRVGLPLEGVGLPGHFIVRIRAARSILVDPFHGGRVLTRRDCVDRLQAMGYTFRESFLEPVSDRRMLIRALGNLLHTVGFGDDQLLSGAVQEARRSLV